MAIAMAVAVTGTSAASSLLLLAKISQLDSLKGPYCRWSEANNLLLRHHCHNALTSKVYGMSVVGKYRNPPHLHTKARGQSSSLISPNCGDASFLLRTDMDVHWLAVGDILSFLSHTTLLVPQTERQRGDEEAQRRDTLTGVAPCGDLGAFFKVRSSIWYSPSLLASARYQVGVRSVGGKDEVSRVVNLKGDHQLLERMQAFHALFKDPKLLLALGMRHLNIA